MPQFISSEFKKYIQFLNGLNNVLSNQSRVCFLVAKTFDPPEISSLRKRFRRNKKERKIGFSSQKYRKFAIDQNRYKVY